MPLGGSNSGADIPFEHVMISTHAGSRGISGGVIPMPQMGKKEKNDIVFFHNSDLGLGIGGRKGGQYATIW